MCASVRLGVSHLSFSSGCADVRDHRQRSSLDQQRDLWSCHIRPWGRCPGQSMDDHGHARHVVCASRQDAGRRRLHARVAQPMDGRPRREGGAS